MTYKKRFCIIRILITLLIALHMTTTAIGSTSAAEARTTPQNSGRMLTNEDDRADAPFTGFHLGDISGASINDVAEDSQGNIYIVGEFHGAGDVAVSNIAMWDGTQWHDVGGGVTGGLYHGDELIRYVIPGFINAIAIDSNDNVYVGGYFMEAGGSPATNIAMWNGSTWESLGNFMVFNEIMNMEIDSHDNVFVSGFSFSQVWDGSSWSSLSCGGEEGLVIDQSDIVYYVDYNTPQFSIWDGVICSGFDPFSGTTDNTPLTFVDDISIDPNGNLFVAGNFTHANGVEVNNIAAYQESNTWSALGAGLSHTSGYYSANEVASSSSGTYVGGTFDMAGSTSVNRIAYWNNVSESWEALGNGLNGKIKDLFITSSGDLIAGGYFTEAGTGIANKVAQWDGSDWSALDQTHGDGINGPVYTLAFDELSETLYAGGVFSYSGDVLVNNIAAWDGSSWSALGDGIDGYVYALTVDNSGNLIVGGSFDTAGGVSASNIARWNGTTWSAMNAGMDDTVYALAIDSGNELFAAGKFDKAGTATDVNSIAHWTGTDWEALGRGLEVTTYSGTEQKTGYTLAVDDLDQIYAAGQEIACVWDGTGWTHLNSEEWGVSGTIYTSAFVDGMYYAGGDFDLYLYEDNFQMATYDGTTWEQLGGGEVGYAYSSYYKSVRSFLFDSQSDQILIGGHFMTIHTNTYYDPSDVIFADNIASYDPTNGWQSFGDGAKGSTYGRVYAMLQLRDGTIVVGGQFGQFDGVVSSNIAFWGDESAEVTSELFLPLLFR